MRISIAMTTYNGSKYLNDQLKSFSQQDQAPDELIVCDDGSSDNTIKILEKFSLNAPFDVKIYQNESNLGFTKNFENALSKCTGDLIFLSDQDDIWFQNKISSITEYFYLNENISLIIHDAEIVDENLKYHGSNTLSQALRGFGNTNIYITGALTVIRKDLLDYVFPFPENINGHDGWIHNVGKVLERRQVLKKSLGLIRRHADNTSGWVASSIEKISFFDVLKAQIHSVIKKPNQNYDDRILLNHSLMKVIDKFKNNHNKDDIHFLSQKENYLKSELSALIRRNDMQSSSFLIRKLKALSLLLRGDYVYFNNVKSFIRDMIR